MSSQIARVNMIKQQLRTGDVLDERILALYESVPRDAFVPPSYKPFAYSDMHIPLAHQQCMMTPLEEAKLVQSLALQGHEVVLEIGTGTGFLTALLSRLSKRVISVDYYEEFTAQARQHLTNHACNNVELLTGDACQGWLNLAPYDIIVFTGALASLNETIRLQLLPGGKMFTVLGKAPIMRAQLHTLSHDAVWTDELVFETNVPPLINKLKPHDFVF